MDLIFLLHLPRVVYNIPRYFTVFIVGNIKYVSGYVQKF